MAKRKPNYLFVTGKLAAPSLAATLETMKPNFDYTIKALKITVAALMNTEWISKHIDDADNYDAIIIPGLCRGDIGILEDRFGKPVERGPKDLKDLPAFFGGEAESLDLSGYQTKILAEIVDAYELDLDSILARAEYYRKCGADFIDLGSPPSEGFPRIGESVSMLKKAGFAVSVDTFDPDTIIQADRAGMDLLLSVNSRNLEIARDIRAKVVVIPDFGEGLESLEKNAAQLSEWGVEHILDPILDPIGFGFTESVCRFVETRARYPEAEILMGLGNLTELTDADTTGLNALLAGIMAELDVNYALTTEVSPHAAGAVRELDRARRLMHYAVKNRVLPKRLDSGLLTVKDPPHDEYNDEELQRIQEQLRDKNYRIFVSNGKVTIFNRDVFLQGNDPQKLFNKLDVDVPGHAFYLGRELERAALAAKLGKKYTQESPLRFGYFTDPGEEQ